MVHGKTVLAPAITGIPELVRDGETGFLYRAGSLEDFLSKVDGIRNSRQALTGLRHAAREHVLQHFNRDKNLTALVDLILSRITPNERHDSHENRVLQQI
jgi:colanic acid/amylovoran biosynthesis glycosyltransferase